MNESDKSDTLADAMRKAAAGGCGDLVASFHAKSTEQIEKIGGTLAELGLEVAWRTVETGTGDTRCVEVEAIWPAETPVGYIKMCCDLDPRSRIEFGSGGLISSSMAWPEPSPPQDWKKFAVALTKTLRDKQR